MLNAEFREYESVEKILEEYRAAQEFNFRFGQRRSAGK